MKSCIAAFTHPGPDYAPAYVNISVDDDGLVYISVREQSAQTTNCIAMSKDDFAALFEQMYLSIEIWKPKDGPTPVIVPY